jgi:hypothetical protein
MDQQSSLVSQLSSFNVTLVLRCALGAEVSEPICAVAEAPRGEAGSRVSPEIPSSQRDPSADILVASARPTGAGWIRDPGATSRQTRYPIQVPCSCVT